MITQKLLAAFLALTIGGCAIHAPMSESLLYAESKPAQSLAAGIGLSYTIIPAKWDDILAEAERRYRDDPRVEIDPANLRKQGVSVSPLWYLADRSAALSFSLGAPTGADLTIRVPGSVYVTAVGSLSGGMETIAQRVVFDSEYLGISAGLSYRAEQHAFYVYRDYNDGAPSTYLTPNETFPSKSFGIRLTGLVFERSQSSPFVRAVFFGGYSTTFESAVARFSISTGAF